MGWFPPPGGRKPASVLTGPDPPVAVLGGGLLGACTALELARHGIATDVWDRCGEPLTQASAQNEGKVHLGYVYANDPSLRTARTMVRGAASFFPLLRRWIGDDLDGVARSAPFHYVVHREGLLDADGVARHLERCRRLSGELGVDLPSAPTRLTVAEWDSSFDRRRVAAVFATPEIAVDPLQLAAALRRRVAEEPLVRLQLETEVEAVDVSASGATVLGSRRGTSFQARYGQVVNALWEGRRIVDQRAGFDDRGPWLVRYKRYVRLPPGTVAAEAGIPSATIVLGRFGDTVAYPDGSLYLSWYPAGLSAFSSGACRPEVPELDGGERRSLVERTARELGRVVPTIASLTRAQLADATVGGGYIVARGRTDIADPGSLLHERHAIGPRSHGCYHTVDTGKLTTAPLFASEVAERVRLAL